MADLAIGSELRRRIDREASVLKAPRLTPEAVSWGDGPDPSKFWIPESMVALSGTPAIEQLTDEERLRFNQYCALMLTEQFIWLEGRLIIPPLERLLRGTVPGPSLRILIESFVIDERAHSASLYRLLELARPEFYRTGALHFFAPPRKVRLLIALMARLPRLLSGWVLFSGVLEEHTIAISRCYKEAGAEVDPLFARVYGLHAIDEARHCKLDTLIAEWLIDRQDGWEKRVNEKLFSLAFHAYYDPDWGYDRLVGQLVADFPALGGAKAEIIRKTINARSQAAAELWFNQSVSPITLRNARNYKMLDRAIRRLSEMGRHDRA